MQITKASRILFIAVISMVLANKAFGSGVLTTVNWVSDSYSSYHVILSGNGLGWSGAVTSPSGLWQIYSENDIAYPSVLEGSVGIDNWAVALFLGQLPPQYPAPSPYTGGFDAPFCGGPILFNQGGYYDTFAPAAPINDGIGLDYGYLAGTLGGYYSSLPGATDWSGNATISITSIPDVNDVSTWTWQAEVIGSGMIEAVPEPSTLTLAGLSGVFLMLFHCRRKMRRFDLIILHSQHRSKPVVY